VKLAIWSTTTPHENSPYHRPIRVKIFAATRSISEKAPRICPTEVISPSLTRGRPQARCNDNTSAATTAGVPTAIFGYPFAQGAIPRGSRHR
jgi:hypothetical protein